jgi:hypothetical protein
MDESSLLLVAPQHVEVDFHVVARSRLWMERTGENPSIT